MRPGRALAAVAAAACTAATLHTLWNLRILRRPDRIGAPGRISVLVPARDEQHRIGPTLDSLRSLTGVHETLVLDDNSRDRTADMVRAAGLPLLQSHDEPPPGWLGKPWACHRLAQAATGDVLVFVDADVTLTPDAAVRAAALLEDVELVCPYPRQITTGVLQRLVQPLLQWSWLTFLPLGLAERSAHPALVAGNGQFLAVRAAAYHEAGGHAAVRGEVLEDLALARRFKASGFRAAMADGTTIASCHMYARDRDLVDGYTKSLHDAFGPGTLLVLGGMYLAPLAGLLVSRDRPTRALCLTAYCAAVAGRLAVAGRTGQSQADSITHPLSVAALSGLYVRSVVAHRRGRIQWRGRALG